MSKSIRQVFLTGCGDSHHAAVNATLAFHQLAGVPCHALTAMQFARYSSGYLPMDEPGTVLVIAVSASGQVSRTIEALELAAKSGSTTVAVTRADSPLAQAAERVLSVTLSPMPLNDSNIVVPGTRSYVAAQLALYLTAIHLGAIRGHLGRALANRLRRELAGIAELMEATIARCDSSSRQAANDWLDADHFVFCGAGPNYGTALYGAAKLLEASGDAAVGQDLEEWAHLQYFGRSKTTPTILMSAAGWDEDRALEIAVAAKAVGRRVGIVAPELTALAEYPDCDIHFPLVGKVRECFSPLLTSIPPMLIAAYRAQILGEPYFRDFGDGRSREGGGGISRIRTSNRIVDPRR